MKTFEPDDPMAMVGVQFDDDPDDEAQGEMSQVIVEEYLRLGWSGDQILRLFQRPVFRMSHRILEVKGEAFLRDLVAAADAVRRQVNALEEIP